MKFLAMDEVKAIGRKLVEAAKSEPFSAQQGGVVEELLPFMEEASKRMSARAISRWLERHGVSLSSVTIAKALRSKWKKRE